MSRYSGAGPFSRRETRHTKQVEAKERQAAYDALTPEERIKRELDWHGTEPSEWLTKLIAEKHA